MDRVIEALRESLSADPSNHAVRAHLAQLLLDAGRAAEALDEATTVLASVPDDVAALRTAAAAATAAGDHSRASAFARLADALAPEQDGQTSRRPERGTDLESPTDDTADPRDADRDLAVAVPNTADEILEGWTDTDALVEPELGSMSRPGVTLADVGGLSEVKRRLELSFLAPMRNPELRAQFGKALRGGLLLWGPPGCGKTFIARALAGELGANFYEVGLSDVLDMYIGSSERNLRSIFDAARRNRPCLLFFDEIDALGQKRSHLRHDSWLRTVVNTLLTEMDSVSSRNDGVFVLGATNQPWDVDPALRRPGRFDRMVLVLPPDPPARQALLTMRLADRPNEELDIRRLVESTEDFSGADITHLVDSAAELALADSMVLGKIRPITMADFRTALREVKPSTGPWLSSARNVTMFGNTDGSYDDLLAYLKRRGMA